jgi:protein-disulfide isomerase
MQPDNESQPGADAPAHAPTPTGPNWPLLAFAVAAGALIVSAITWYQSSSAIDELRTAQRGLMADLARASRAPVIDLADASTLGRADALVALVEYSDYECPYCIRHFQQTMPQIVDNYVKTGKIRYAFRDWPVDQLHPQAIRAHEAGHCAREQNRFWELHPRLFGPPGSHAPGQLLAAAREVGLDMTAFAACVDSGRSAPAIRATGAQAVEIGATGTPAFFLGLHDKTTQQVTVLHGLSGALPYEDFARALDAVIAKAR